MTRADGSAQELSQQGADNEEPKLLVIRTLTTVSVVPLSNYREEEDCRQMTISEAVEYEMGLSPEEQAHAVVEGVEFLPASQIRTFTEVRKVPHDFDVSSVTITAGMDSHRDSGK